MLISPMPSTAGNAPDGAEIQHPVQIYDGGRDAKPEPLPAASQGAYLQWAGLEVELGLKPRHSE